MPVTNIFHNLLMKRPSRFLRNAVYIVLIHERRESNCAIGFFHHKKYETGFLAYAGFTTEIRTTKVDWNEGELYFVSYSTTSLNVLFHRT